MYSDILMIPDAMGMGLNFATGEGPVFDFYINNVDALNQLNVKNINERLSYVFELIKLCLKKLPENFPLLGFAGAPFTVACYMIAGSSKNQFEEVKSFAWTQPRVFHELMTVITEATIEYLKGQVDAGVTAIQLFDTWAGLLSLEDYRILAKPYTQKVFDALNSSYVPTIHYIKGGSYLLSDMAELSSDVISVDWRVDLKSVQQVTQNRYAIQGNFDPVLLMTTQDIIQERLQEMLKAVPNPKKGYIINLGHGIGKNTPVKNAKFFVDKAKSLFM
ncbi:uroporphyrinogen decarboxylase [bacterium K02(2017)]|nr:uroporphyrinogen decarboxylase [bacterium K02(2017)]